jgi:crotonobetainyl-CoA:carnitine CoA-transferase CaiB-like acyl-CoA transferase
MERPDLANTLAYKTTGQRMECMPEIDAQIHQWASQRTVDQCVAAFEGTNVASGPIAPLDQFPREANLEHRAMVRQIVDKQHKRSVYVPGSPIRCAHSAVLNPPDVPAPDEGREAVRDWLRAAPDSPGSTSPSPSANADLPLRGIRVVEIGHYTTAPLSARHLASLGAEVIKIEPRGGEGMRAWPPSKAGQGIFFTYTNTNKKSMALDLNSAAGASVFAALIRSADVLIENLKPGALAKRGFSWEQLSALNPRLIYCAISGFGEDTIYTGRAAFDTVIQAMCGLMAANLSNGVPVKAGISSADLMGAQLCVLNVLAALAARERTGTGEFFDLAMQDVAAWATQTVWNLSPEKLNYPRHHIVACADGVIAVAGGHASNPAREESTHLSREQAATAINANGGQAAPVLSVAEAAQHAQTIARGLMFEATDYRNISWPMMASPLRLSATPPQVNEPMGELGRQTADVLRSIGLDPDDPAVSAATASA